MKILTLTGRLAAVGFISAASVGLWGCPNPNAIGVQQYGSIKVTCVQASNNQPVAGALVSVGNIAQEADGNGVVTLSNVPIGQQLVIADAPGLHGQQTVTVTQGNTSNVTIPMSPS